ncbi:MAG TPA: ribonuclease HI [Candidatus Acetothermia bacterium]|nr:ribonuclease HI [Candidatus Acetothermia bacterium]
MVTGSYYPARGRCRGWGQRLYLVSVKRVRIYTDGACIGNPGPGGWAAVLISGAHRKEIWGREGRTTNNRMELRSAIEALAALREPAEVDLYTDSTYLKRGITEWLPRWKELGWRRREGKRLVPVANEDLWRELDRLVGIHRVRFHWLAGHAGDVENERADALARRAAEGAGGS